MTGSMVLKIADELENMCPLERLPERREWRDNCLIKLSKLKKQIWNWSEFKIYEVRLFAVIQSIKCNIKQKSKNENFNKFPECIQTVNDACIKSFIHFTSNWYQWNILYNKMSKCLGSRKPIIFEKIDHNPQYNNQRFQYFCWQPNQSVPNCRFNRDVSSIKYVQCTMYNIRLINNKYFIASIRMLSASFRFAWKRLSILSCVWFWLLIKLACQMHPNHRWCLP